MLFTSSAIKFDVSGLLSELGEYLWRSISVYCLAIDKTLSMLLPWQGQELPSEVSVNG